MLSLYQLRIFLTVAEEENLTRAAERLYLTQPAVSQHIRALEKQMGVPLFYRSRRGMTLTPAGEALVDYAQRILRLTAEAHQAVLAASDKATGELYVGASPGAGPCLMPTWIKAFHEHYPKMFIHLKTGPTPTIVRALTRGDVEIAIVEGEVESTAFNITPLWDEEIVIVVGQRHAWWGRADINPEMLRGQAFIVREQGSLTRLWEEKTLARFGITPRVVAEFDSPLTIKRAVQSGLGIALLPRFAIRQEVQAGLLHPVRLQNETLYRTLKLLWTAETLHNPAAKAFLQILSAEFPHISVQILGLTQKGGRRTSGPLRHRSHPGEKEEVPSVRSE
ncbi:MAG: LysR family transcriptional regulator [Chloroflexi bacterium]|nr:LysR family transcriptional regulator [Chloroflexota bacterium]